MTSEILYLVSLTVFDENDTYEIRWRDTIGIFNDLNKAKQVVKEEKSN